LAIFSHFFPRCFSQKKDNGKAKAKELVHDDSSPTCLSDFTISPSSSAKSSWSIFGIETAE